MTDPLTDLLLGGARQLLVSSLWVLLFATLGLLMLCSLRVASRGNSPHHPLVWVTLAMCVWSLTLLIWCTYQPELLWGLVGVGGPVFGVLLSTFRPRRTRRSGMHG